MDEYTPKHSEPVTADEQKNKRKKLLWLITSIVAGIILVASCVIIYMQFFVDDTKEYNFGKYKNPTTSTPTNSSTEPEEVLPLNPINFEAVQETNPDVCAWIKIDGTVIDYPILQSDPEANDNYYLDHDINRQEKRAGSIYIQKLNSKLFTDPNTLIYGHNMLNGTMFGQLKKYRDKAFFDQNRYIEVYTPGHILKYEIISAFVYDDRHILNSFKFKVEAERQEFFDTCVNPPSVKKQVLEGASLELDDKIITLSTCTSNDSERYLVVGKLISDTLTQ